MLTVGKQRQESTVGNVTTVWKAKKERNNKPPKKLYVPQFLSSVQKMESVENSEISECAIVLNHHYFYLV